MDAILESQEQLQVLFLQKMDAFQEELKKSPSPVSTSSVAAEFSSFRVFILATLKSLQDQITLLARESDNQEMRTRRKILLIHGLPEVTKEDTSATVVKAVVQQLKVADFTASDISRCHRMGRLSSSDRPRPILVKVLNMTLRNKLWYAKTALKGSGVTLSEFLTKPRHETFMAARQRFGVTKCWTRDGFVFVIGSDGSRHRISCVAEINKIVVPTSPAAGPKSSKPPTAKEPVTTRVRRPVAASKK